ncbi:endo-1,4-beta-xylanase 5-like [Lactuca sativa]|uniref:GH10 domain-containing protein n=1 Tax=Lactuca sativa TaxID=4236 RepID=A0A9R1UXW9_LACSA|nr:endo-1,4-beta-xylanase 5-like [Lactuca sativa]KAJ0194726.1 hypothetical protein LSAT_V11C700375460 [Lactuca sativa]
MKTLIIIFLLPCILLLLVHAQVNDDSFDPYATLFSPYTKQEWRSYQEKKINEGRKTELTFEVSYVNGTKVRGAKLYIKQLTSDFHWGCGMTHRILNNTAYKKWFASRFTAADFHNELKWYWTEATQGQENYADPDAMIKFADEHGIIVRGHTILWDDVKYNQKWVRKLSPEQLLEAANRRVDSVVNRYKGRLIGWDVMNENLHHNFFEKRLGKNASSLFFNRVHKIDPNAVLFMNEFNTTEHVNDEYAPPVKYLRRMKKIQSFPGNSEVKMGIGLESHYGAEPIDFHYVRSSLDSLSQTGLPIWLTELDVKMDPNLKNWSGLQVIYLEEILRESFSHEAVKAMIIWTGASIDGCDVMCMADENLVNTPIGDLIDGLMEEWRTGEIEAMADFNGSCQVSVFNGGYEVKVVDPVSNASSRVSLKVDKVSIPDKMVHVQIMG